MTMFDSLSDTLDRTFKLVAELEERLRPVSNLHLQPPNLNESCDKPCAAQRPELLSRITELDERLIQLNHTLARNIESLIV